MDCDRILVLSDGKLAEFDKPSTLLGKRYLIFKIALATTSNHGGPVLLENMEPWEIEHYQTSPSLPTSC